METRATFRLIGEAGCTAAHVTERLGIEPSRAHQAGTPLGTSSELLREESWWGLSSSPEVQEGVELADQLRLLFDRLEPVAGVLWELVVEGYWANWFCYLGSRAFEHAAELDRPTMQRLLALPGDLWLDVYPEEEGEECADENAEDDDDEDDHEPCSCPEVNGGARIRGATTRDGVPR